MPDRVPDAERKIEEAVAAGSNELDLHGCRLTEVPESVRALTKLYNLRLARNKLTALPEWLGELTGLGQLDVSDNKITELPASFGELRRLEFVNLQMNKLTSLPESTARLRFLSWLNLNGNKLPEVPEALMRLPRLVRLVLSANKLTTVPAALGGLTSLVRLDLGWNKLTELPPAIGGLTELRFLYLSNNRLTALPDTIGNLVELVELELHENRLTGLPATMDRLSRLTELSLFHNDISSPPAVLANMPNLTTLVLLGNPLPDAEAFSRGLEPPAVRPQGSELFEEFMAGVNTPITFNRDVIDEIPNVGVVEWLEGEERTEAEDVLIAMLRKNDGRAATALADLDCRRAIPALVEATTAAAPPVMRVFAARALLRMDDLSGLPGIVELLRSRDPDYHSHDRASAVRLMAEFPDPDRELLLERAMHDHDQDVRHAAFEAALTVSHLDGEDTRDGEVLLGIGGRLLSSLTSVRAEAMAELREILARRDDGETAERLNLTWHIDKYRRPWSRLIDSLDRDGLNYPLHGLLELTGPERTVLENLILNWLDRDRRAVRAAKALTIHRAVPALREMLGTAEGHARTEIESVLGYLTAPA